MVGTPFWSERFQAGERSKPFIVHPPLRCALFAALILLPVFLNGLAALSVLFVYLCCISIYCRVPSALLVSAVRSVSPFIALIVILNMLFSGDGQGGPVTGDGLMRGGVLAARVLVMYAALVVWIATTSQEEMARAAAAFVRPFSPRASGRCAMIGFISFGFLPVFFEEYERIRLVQRFRGMERRRGILDRMRGMQAVLIPLMVSAVRRSAQLSMAVELRAVQETIGVLFAGEGPGRGDYARVLLTAAVVATLLILNV
jgi:energy-coupling factor transport system permease protein